MDTQTSKIKILLKNLYVIVVKNINIVNNYLNIEVVVVKLQKQHM
jgi:hypothetical protein